MDKTTVCVVADGKGGWVKVEVIKRNAFVGQFKKCPPNYWLLTLNEEHI